MSDHPHFKEAPRTRLAARREAARRFREAVGTRYWLIDAQGAKGRRIAAGRSKVNDNALQG